MEKFVIQDVKGFLTNETIVEFDVTGITEYWKLLNYTESLVSINIRTFLYDPNKVCKIELEKWNCAFKHTL